jgi:MBG domain (YGX type)/Cadherin-like beta sandwich domain
MKTRFSLLLATFSLALVSTGQAVTVVFSSSGSWTVPSGVTSATITCYGAGGGSGGAVANSSDNASGGGGGGATATSTLSVSGGQVYTVTVGAGGTAGANTGTNGGTGGTTTFTGTGGTVTAAGGSGGGGVTVASGSSGVGTAGVGAAAGTGGFAGGNGTTGLATTANEVGGAGGGGAGNAGAGGNGTQTAANANTTGGSGGIGSPNSAPFTGAAGAGATTTTGTLAGVAGTAPGGGAAGAATFTTAAAGAVGGAGQVVVTYTPPPISGTKTVGPTGNYATLTAAFADLNASSVNGATILELQSTYVSTSETFPIAPGNIPGNNATNTITVRPATGATNLSITSSNTTATVDLNGTQNVIFDGQPGGTGGSQQLTLANTSTSGVALRFINDAISNTIKFCTVQGVNTSITSGVVLFSTTTGANGNNSNTITNCAIKAGASTPTNGIYSAGTAAHTNNNNSITNNTIQDFFAAGTASVGILVGTNSSGWTITGNQLFQSATRTSTTASTYGGIEILSSGNGFTVSNNTIGYASAASTGTMTYTGAVTSKFYGIELTVGTTTASSVQGNTITAISFTTAGPTGFAYPGIFSGIYVTAGTVNIGTTTGNTVGAASGTGAITVTSTGSSATMTGISAASTSTVNIQNNTVASLTFTGSTSVALYFSVITTSGTAGVFNVSSNNIGSATASSIQDGPSGSTAANQLYGIDLENTGAKTCSSNVINNLVQNGSSTTGFTTTGINSAGSTSVTINSNTISNVSSAAAFAGLDCIGITLGDGAVASESITGNTISGLSTTSASASVVGIFFNNSGASSGTISQNKIYGLSASSATLPTLYGMFIEPTVVTPTGTFNVYNNMISVTNGSNTNAVSIYGILDFTSSTTTSSNTFNYFYNSIYIGGSASSGTAVSYCFNSQKSSSVSNSDKIIFKDNILHNVRTGGTGVQYAVAVTNSGTGTWTSDYNVFDAPTTTIGSWAGTNETFANWKTAEGNQDAHSLTAATFTFTAPTTGDLHLSSTTTALNVGTPITTPISITTDFDGDTRNASTPYIGADEIVAPTVTTGTAGSVTSSSATISGNNVSSDGGSAITQRGVVYSTNANPTTSDSKVIVAGTTGAFNANLSGLNANTIYHVRAYATNSIATAYGSDVSFTTLASSNADLSNLVLSSGALSPSFASGTTSYTASVSNATSSMTVTPSAADGTATIQVRVNGGSFATVTSGSPSGSLALTNVYPSTNTIDVKVTAQDTVTIKTYTVTVTRRATQTITGLAATDTKTYGDSNYSLTATGGGSGNPVTYVSSNTAVATISGSTVHIVAAGSTTITASQAGNSNYDAAPDATQTLTVNRKAVTVTPDSGQYKIKGASDPTFTYGTSGLVTGDSLAGTLSRNSGESAGSYAITQGTVTNANNPNYNITFTTGVNFVIAGALATNDSVSRTANSSSFKIPITTLLANDNRVDTDGSLKTDQLSISAVQSGTGNTVSMSGAFVFYTPNDPTASDPLTFTYTLSDAATSTTDTGTVTVNTTAPAPFTLTIVDIPSPAMFDGTNTSITVDFVSVPNQTINPFEYSTDLMTWTSVGSVSTGSTGSFAVTITTPGDHAAQWNAGMFFRGTRQ